MNALMKCGHRAHGTDQDGTPCCTTCLMFTELAYQPVDVQPDLIGRKAQCAQCKKERQSSVELPFFQYNENRTHDHFYCGCRGWS